LNATLPECQNGTLPGNGTAGNDTNTYVPPPSWILCNPATQVSEGQGISIYSTGPPVCLVMVGNSDFTTQTWATSNQTGFTPKVDDFSLLQVANSHSTNTTTGRWISAPDVNIRLEIGGLVSPWKSRSRDGLVVPFWTAILDVDNGRLNSIYWDDGCYECDDSQCINATCAVPVSTCYEVTYTGFSTGGTNNCDLKIYIGWKGQDKDGNYLTSSARRLSAFRSYSLSSVYNTAKSTKLPSIPSVSQTVCSSDVPGC